MQSLQNLLIEMSRANFNVRIKRSGKDTPIEGVISTANMFAEEAEGFIKKQDLATLLADHIPLSYTSFILNRRLHIRYFCPKTAKALSLDPRTLRGRPFGSLLSEESEASWRHMKNLLHKKQHVEEPVAISFTLPHGLILPVYCRISALHGKKKTRWAVMLKTLTPVKKETTGKRKNKRKSNLYPDDLQKLQEIKLHILQSPEKPLPRLDQLARQYGINEYKLKCGFRDLFDTTVFRLQRRERLKKAKTLVVNTKKPFKAIARSIGYNLTHFYKAFKEEYGKTPGALRKGR